MSADLPDSRDPARPPALRTARQRFAALLGVGVLAFGSADEVALAATTIDAGIP